MIACAKIKQQYFLRYSCKESLEICVDLSTFIQVLTIFGTECEFRIEYTKSTNYMRIWLSDNVQPSITECELFTFAELEHEIPNLYWSSQRIINYFIIHSRYISDIFNEIDAFATDDQIICFHIQTLSEKKNYAIN